MCDHHESFLMEQESDSDAPIEYLLPSTKPMDDVQPETTSDEEPSPTEDEKDCSVESVSSNSASESESEDFQELEHDSLIVLLDWDDTLFPTTMLNEILQCRDSNDLALVRDDQIEYLTQLGQLTLSLLKHLIGKYGADSIHICTNSLEGWIKESLCYAACITPIYKDIDSLLVAHNITMVSAQSSWKKVEGSTPIQWKQWCFDEILRVSPDRYRHVVSIGDQWTDHHSAKQSIASLQISAQHHVIKLKMSPTVNDMINEILYIEACFEHIFNVISCKSSVYFANPHSVQPVVIDYEVEELKQYYSQCLNTNVNLSSNVNVVSHDYPQPVRV